MKGLAWNQQYTGNGGISISCYGDGASSQGQLYEAYNLSKLWKLPAIFVCENNQYGMGTSVDRHSASTEFYKRAGYLPGGLAYFWTSTTQNCYWWTIFKL